jgi:hypothetical protein
MSYTVRPGLLHACRQEIICPGELADKMYLIASGEVEILQGVTGGIAGDESLISGVHMDLGECQDGDMFDSSVPDLSSSPTGGWNPCVGSRKEAGCMSSSTTHLP